MRIKKTLLAFAATALAATALASSAMAAEDGVVRDVGTGLPIAAGTKLHFIGWAKFQTGAGTFMCHVTSVAEAETGSTGHVTQFTVPDTTLCTGTGGLNKCKLKEHTSTNLPWHLTATKTDFDVTGNIVIDNVFKECELGTRSATLTFSEITLKPLKTGTTAATGTAGNLGSTAGSTDPIAGVEISGTGTAVTIDVFGIKHTEAATASGELELTSPERCTYRLAES